MIKEKKNLFYFQSMEETSCSNCKLQGKGGLNFGQWNVGVAVVRAFIFVEAVRKNMRENNYFPPGNG